MPAKFSTGEFAGEYNPEDIRGSYTFQDVADTPSRSILGVLFDAFGIPADTDGADHQDQGYRGRNTARRRSATDRCSCSWACTRGLPVELIDTWLTPRGGGDYPGSQSET